MELRAGLIAAIATVLIAVPSYSSEEWEDGDRGEDYLPRTSLLASGFVAVSLSGDSGPWTEYDNIWGTKALFTLQQRLTVLNPPRDDEVVYQQTDWHGTKKLTYNEWRTAKSLRRYVVSIYGGLSYGRMWAIFEPSEGEKDLAGNLVETEHSNIDELTGSLTWELSTYRGDRGGYFTIGYGSRFMDDFLGDKNATAFNFTIGGFRRSAETFGFDLGCGIDAIKGETTFFFFELGLRFRLR